MLTVNTPEISVHRYIIAICKACKEVKRDTNELKTVLAFDVNICRGIRRNNNATSTHEVGSKSTGTKVCSCHGITINNSCNIQLWQRCSRPISLALICLNDIYAVDSCRIYTDKGRLVVVFIK